MSEQDSSWKPIERYSDFEEAMRPDDMAEWLREMMEESNEADHAWFIICSQVIADDKDTDTALFSPDFEGELVGVDGESDDAVLIIKNVTVMQGEDAPEPEVIKYTTLEQRETMRIPLISVANIMGNGSRLGNDYTASS